MRLAKKPLRQWKWMDCMSMCCIEGLKGLLLCSICIWWFAGKFTWCHSLTYPNTYPKSYTNHGVTRWHILSLIIIISLLNEQSQYDPTFSRKVVATVKLDELYANVVLLKAWKVCCFATSVFDDLQANSHNVTRWHTQTLILTATLIMMSLADLPLPLY